MPIVASDWTITRSNGNIRYIGQDHNGGAKITAGSFVVGDYYRINTAGTTDFTLIGAADSNPGTEFIATGVGSGTGTADEAASYATVIEFHRWAQSLADDATSSGDDQLARSDKNPSKRSTDNIISIVNGYNVTATEIEHMYDGTIIQGSGGTLERWDGLVNYGNASNMIQLHQDGAVIADDFWNYSRGGTATGGTATVLTDTDNNYTTDEWVGYTIKNVTDGSQGIITANDATTITVGALHGGTANTFSTSDVYLIARGINPLASKGISHRFMVKVTNAGADIDGRRLIGQSRRYGNTFTEFQINGTSQGNNTLALSDTGDLNNATAHATIDAYNDVTIDRTDSTTTVSGVNSGTTLNVVSGAAFAIGEFINIAGFDDEYKITNIVTNALTLNRALVSSTAGGETVYILNIGYSSIDVDNNAVNENYYAQWDKGAQTINGFFEKLKLISADSTEHYVYGLPGEQFRGITHEITVDTNVGTFHDVEELTWTEATIPSAGQMLAVDAVGAATKIYLQLTKGIAPTDGTVLTGTDSGATSAVNVTVTDWSSTLTKPFVGASTGTALIGPYGLTLQTADLSKDDKVFDLTNTQITPPNNVTNTVGSLAVGDSVFVAPWDGSTYDTEGNPVPTKTGITLSTTLSTSTETQVVVSSIPADTPATGSIRVTLDGGNGDEQVVRYSSWSGTTYTMDSGHADYATFRDFSGTNATSGNDVYITYLDVVTTGTSESYIAVFSSTRNLMVSVRDGGGTPIKEFISTWTFDSANQTLNAIRTSDA